MRKYMNAELMGHEMELRQMGGEIKAIDSKLVFVTFHVGEYEIGYVYNVNSKNKYFLERTKPYPLPLREFDNEADVIDIIRIDLEQFENAARSHNMPAFVGMSNELVIAVKKFEDLFLYYNVAPETIQGITQHIKGIQSLLQEAKQTAKKVYDKKEPFTL